MNDKLKPKSHDSQNPLDSLEDWDDFVKERYPLQYDADAPSNGTPSVGTDPNKKKSEFRNYEAGARSSVREFYRLNHRGQTVDFGREKRKEYLSLQRKRMGVWEAVEYLNTLVDDSDPDTDLSQLDHLLQTSEQIRKDGHPGWFVLTGLIHDLGKILCLYGEPQWAVVGDTFPVGCAFSDKIVFHEYFDENPDKHHPEYSAQTGVYREGCGLDQVQMSWGHDEYLYHVVRDYLPDEALYMIRYHSFYPWHKENEYVQFTNEKDREMLYWVRKFNPYDLYTKSHEKPDLKQLRPYYNDLIAEYFPDKINW